MEGVSTDSLRTLAPKWTLAGDDQLLNLLQSTHQRIVSKCQDVNSRLEEMASALDDASINLQNVNNKFMALSNSQFIESRVYDDDDADLTTDTQPVQESRPPPVDEVSILKASLAALERAHDTAEIFDESDSDSDAEISVVLKPKDLYSHRPLPYIIGSQSWKNKWHAGLIVEDSDSDSCTSKRDGDIEQYSDSEEENLRPTLEENTLSESSSSLPGSLGAPPPPACGVPARPADIAAALARRLAADTAQIVQEEEEYTPAAPAQPRKLYKPEQPASSAIFLDEPPPLEESSGQSSDEDIFAEINKHTPYTQKNRVPNNLAEDLFSFDKPSVEQGDIFNDFAPTQIEKQSSKQKSSLFNEESEPELFAEPSKKEIQHIEPEEPSIKKPVGGISLFGSNKGAESIGAAILKRNQRKSSSSGDDSGSNDVNNQTDTVKKHMADKPKVLPRSSDKTEHKTLPSKNVDETDNESTKKEKDIFNDLFSKSEKVQNKIAHTAAKESLKVATIKEKEKPSVKDLFSENLFDDIDDIFTSNVKIPRKESNQKSIFDDDDLFSDIDTAKTTIQSKDSKTSVKESNKSIFESDDELFSDIKTDSNKPAIKNVESLTTKDIKFTNESIDSEKLSKIENIKKPTEISKERSLLDDSPETVKFDRKPQIKSKSIFDSDSDDDIFAKIKTTDKISNNIIENDNKTIDKKGAKPKSNIDINQLSTETLKAKEKKIVQSPSLFEEDEIDDPFIAVNKVNSEANQNKGSEVAETKQSHLHEKKPEVKNNTEVDILNKINDIETDDLPTLTKKDQEPDEKMKTEPILNHNITGESVTLDSNLLNADLFLTSKKVSTPKKVSKNTPDEQSPGVIESSQEVKKTEEISEPKSLLGVKNIKNNEIERGSNETHRSQEEFMKQSVLDDITRSAKEQDISTTEPKINVLNAGVFDEIFTEPPAFEKPAEPKKSKNVNALFDDDSDDESLFFKKDDVISDEKPDIFTKNANFDIFFDEPPDDIDFTEKATKKVDADDNLSSSVPKTNQTIQSIKLVNDEDICSPMQVKKSVPEDTENKSNQKDQIGALKPDKNDVQCTVQNNKTNDLDDMLKKESPKKETEITKIGKINTKNINIDVNALIPGASPKKILKENKNEDRSGSQPGIFKTILDETDFDAYNKVENKVTDRHNQIVKSNDYTESGMLDNNLSKQRPKIQVKRRPSSRKARHEAVRKSAIDFGDDIDNSSFFDEPTPKDIDVGRKANDDSKKLYLSKEEEIKEIHSSNGSNSNNEYNMIKEADLGIKSLRKDEDREEKIRITKEQNTLQKEDKINENSDIFESILTNIPSNLNEITEKEEVSRNLVENKQTTTKIVYILNDEDIFNTDSKNIEKCENTLHSRNLESNSSRSTDGVKTLGKTYKEKEDLHKSTKEEVNPTEDKSIKYKASFFDDSDEELFKKTKKIEKKSTIFDSDSEEDLFSGKKSTEKKNKEVMNRGVKERRDGKFSLFGDDDDDDDLFGVKKEKLEQKQEFSITSTSKETYTSAMIASKSAEPVFDDPLSMLGDND